MTSATARRGALAPPRILAALAVGDGLQLESSARPRARRALLATATPRVLLEPATATSGSSRRSPSGCPAASSAPTPAPLAELLAETAKHHGAFEAIAAPHNWWDWYAAYFAARQDGDTPAQADKAADAYMKEAFDVVVSR